MNSTAPPGALRRCPLRGLALGPALLAALAGAAAAQEVRPSAPAPEDAEADAAEDDGTAEEPTLLITAGRLAEPPFQTPYAMSVVDAQDLMERAYRTTPQALRDIPGVMVQETSPGQGSPYIRGFTGFQNLFLIDGIRLNNSVFRPGPNQYWSTVDPYGLERIEVLKGPSSVLYGSDAIGGTVHAITKDPYAVHGEKPFAGMIEHRMADAANYQHARVELSSALGPRWGVLAGGTFKDFGDMHGGGDVGDQPNTGYEEWNGDLKLEGWLDEGVRLVLAHQRVDQDAVPRTHSTVLGESWEGTSVGSDLQRDLDQERELTYLQLHTTGQDAFFSDSSTSISWHQQDELQDRIRSSGARELEGVEVGTLGFFTHFHSPSPIGLLSYGVEYYRDEVDSFRNRFDEQTPADDIQGPVADDATYQTLGVFLQDRIELSERLDLTLGARFESVEAQADSVRDPVTDERISIDEEWDDVVGSLRFLYELEPERWNLFGGISQGFRAPNLSDVSRFDSARSDEFEIPALGLDPEHYVSYELGVKHRGEDASAQFALFYTDIQDQILRFPTGEVNDEGESEVTKANVGDGYVWGVELAGALRLARAWSVFGHGSWIEGEVENFPVAGAPAADEYLTRLMPLTIQLGLRWDAPERGLWAELVGTWADDADRLSASDEGDTQRIPPGGTPSYAVLDLYAGYRVNEKLSFHFGLENLFDEDYRIHGSGSNRPGRNLLVGTVLRF